ncbi:hypothetical protein C0Q70_17816 [Pomacea canaliculata]|uniref:RING-type domain-containing protein n=1 Tax=Pomacea canaliculata TaxID=400727 RepID=A0A2T7NLG7_POMCA|nr:hypothetical protein C0Q70_17816 [Pomacea canaliculata]
MLKSSADKLDEKCECSCKAVAVFVRLSRKTSKRERGDSLHDRLRAAKLNYSSELLICNSASMMAEAHDRECPVCTSDFTTPKILPCGHLLCRECLITWMDSKFDAGCPLCRCPIVEQSDGSSCDTVDALPTDFVMEALVESARVLSKDHLCCVCEDVRADFICLQCLDMMCTACTKAHRKFSGTRSHDVESVSTVTPERLAASRPALCADHGDKQRTAFASTTDALSVNPVTYIVNVQK